MNCGKCGNELNVDVDNDMITHYECPVCNTHWTEETHKSFTVMLFDKITQLEAENLTLTENLSIANDRLAAIEKELGL